MNQLLSKKELAIALGVTPRTVENYCQRRLIPFVVIPAGKRFDPDDIKSFLEARKFCHHS